MPAELCSTGEQKALLIGLIISHARLTAEIAGAAPILLLDEVAAHLDPGRRAALFAILDDLNCQTFMTGTEASLFSSLEGRAQFLTVSHGPFLGCSHIADGADKAGPAHYVRAHDQTPDAAALAGRAGALCAPYRAAGDRRRRPAKAEARPRAGDRRRRARRAGAEYLAAAGVGTLGLVDDDVVSLSNLQRQVIHDTQAVGLAKTESAARAIARINPHVAVESHALRLTAANAAELVRGYDIVADGSDNFDTRYAVADACAAERKPLVTAAVGRFDGSLTVLKPYETRPTGGAIPPIATCFRNSRRPDWCRPAPKPASSAR